MRTGRAPSGAGRRRELGAAGETLAAAAYVSAGYEVVARNWRCRSGEIDLVCRRGTTLVICEVKTRSSRAFGAPVEAVGRDKQVRLRRLGAQFLETSGTRGVMLRYDVAAVECGVVTIVEGAF